MLKNEPSFASLLVRQSPAMHYGHGWIMGEDGKRWHPSRDQSELLNGLKSKQVKPSAFLIVRIVHFVIKGVKYVTR
ncbi:phage filamentation protein Fil family protein [Trabulsiella odontotermitis]|uniref:phage filamentation protein Fil family protein n=1 Tax=Trabulsiella odontotermitis TaxID=379893 RepID=UPI003ABDF9F4